MIWLKQFFLRKTVSSKNPTVSPEVNSNNSENKKSSFGFRNFKLIDISLIVFVFISSYILWLILDKTIGIRVGEQEEVGGSDMWEAGQHAYPYFMKGHGEEK